MKTRILLIFIFALICTYSNAQVAINTNGDNADESAMLDVKSNEKGILIPRLTTEERNGITNPANGLLVYDITTSGFWYFNGNMGEWSPVSSDVSVAVLSSLDDAKSTEKYLYLGVEAGASDDGSGNNVGVGPMAMEKNINGTGNVAVGKYTLRENVDGDENTSVGAMASGTNISGSENTAVGFTVLAFSQGSQNTAVGSRALLMNSSGSQNTALGTDAGRNSEMGSGNVFIGFEAGKEEEGSDKLYIENSDSSYPLIGGDFAEDEVRINGDLTVSENLDVNSSLDVAGNTHLANDLSVDGSGSVASTFDVGSDATIGGNLTVGQNVSIDGSAYVEDELSVENDANVGGSIEAGNSVDAGFNIYAGNNVYADNNVYSDNLIQAANMVSTLNLKVTNNAAEGRVLTSNEFGLATWQELPEGSNVSEINDLDDARTVGSSVYLGAQAGADNEANRNVGVGRFALLKRFDSYNNVALGYSAGYSSESSSVQGCMFLGNYAGSNNTENYQLFIENSDSPTSIPLIHGDFQNDHLTINGILQITGGNPAEGRVLTSDAEGNASWEQIQISGEVNSLDDLSDARNDGYSITIGSVLGSDDGGNSNTGVGNMAIQNNVSGTYNIAMGRSALYYNTTGSRNVALGSSALEFLTEGIENTAVGTDALYYNQGSMNTALGYQAGFGAYNNPTDGNVFIGYKAGYFESGSNKLYIANSDTDYPLIYGDFANGYAQINGNLYISNTLNVDNKFHVNTTLSQFYTEVKMHDTLELIKELKANDGISSDGDVVVNGDVVIADGKDLKYENYRYGRYQLCGPDFVGRSNYDQEISYTTGTVEAYCYSNSVLRLNAPIHLPHDVTIHKISFYLSTMVDHELIIRVMRKNPNWQGGQYNYILDERYTQTSSGQVTLDFTDLELTEVSDLYNYFIEIQAVPADGAYANDLEINGVTIRYKYDTLNK
jgi:predicted acyltransferase (DUF342 family)